MKQQKSKKCIECGKSFNQYNSLVKVCSNSCAISYAKKQSKKQADKDWKAQKKVLKEKLKTKSDYEKELQKEVNTLVRIIDKGCVCISSLKPLNDKFDAGHFYSVGSNPSLRFNLFNIYAQSVYSNQYLSGDQINFLSGLEQLYSKEHKEYVLSLKSRYKLIKLSIDDLKEKITIARKLVKELKEIDGTYNAFDRLKLRKIINDALGVYLD